MICNKCGTTEDVREALVSYDSNAPANVVLLCMHCYCNMVNDEETIFSHFDDIIE